MSRRSALLLRWSPRVLGVAVCIFLGMFSLDAFGPDQTFWEALPGFFAHILPVLILLCVVALSWRWDWLGGAVFLSLAAAYVVFARDHLLWIPTIAGPLCAVGVLFLISWRAGATRNAD